MNYLLLMISIICSALFCAAIAMCFFRGSKMTDLEFHSFECKKCKRTSLDGTDCIWCNEGIDDRTG